jgi:LacI family transcriptional regulator
LSFSQTFRGSCVVAQWVNAQAGVAVTSLTAQRRGEGDLVTSIGSGHERNVTLLDIAADVGVSRATVSLVMRNSPLVAEGTRARVLDSAARLGYRYNRAAASLRSRRSGTLGIVVNNVGNPFYGELTTGVEMAVSGSGRSVVLGQHLEDLEAQQQLLDRLLEYRVDGIILTAAPATKADTIRRIALTGVPVLLAIRRVRGADAVYVGADVVGGAKAAVLHLLTHSPRAIALIGGYEGSSTQRERVRGAKAALAGSDVELVVVSGEPGRESGYLMATTVLKSATRPPAIFAYNDLVAQGAAAAVRDAGYHVGVDVPVVGFDDIEAARYEQPPLTTVSVDPLNMGRLIAERMTGILDGNQRPKDLSTRASLVVRQSCGCHG